MLTNQHGVQVSLTADLHQRGAVPPAGAVSSFCAGQMFTLARVCAQFHFAEAPFRGTGSLIYLCRRPQRARCGGSPDPRRCTQHHTISVNRSTAEPTGGIRAGALRVFPCWCECPLTGILYFILTANARLWFLQCVSHELINTLRLGQDGCLFGR